MKKLIAASITATAAIALLAGCSTSSPDSKDGSTASPKPSETAAAVVDNVCKDGVLTVTDADAAKKALKQGCDTVYLLTSGIDLQLGAVKTLGIEGSDNTVSVDSLESIYILGTGNTVEHGGAAPKADSVQDGNTITAK